VSSSGPRTLDAAIRALGVDRLVHGSDRPVAEPVDPAVLGEAVAHALLEHNAQAALGPVAVAA
jgi:predicted TIM-barrel fold metal-dependent hydrolase